MITTILIIIIKIIMITIIIAIITTTIIMMKIVHVAPNPVQDGSKCKHHPDYNHIQARQKQNTFTL